MSWRHLAVVGVVGGAVLAARLLWNEHPPAVAQHVQVRVLAIDGVPVTGATVRYMDSHVAGQAPSALREWMRLAPDSEALLQRFGAAVTTGDDGIARWPWRGRRGAFWKVGVRLASAWAEAAITATERPGVVHDLRLQDDVSFAVLALGPDDTPIAGVELRAGAVERYASGAEERNERLAEAITDAAGRAEFRHVQTWLPRIRALAATQPFAVRLHVPGGSPRVELDGRALPRAPVVLRMPATGTVRLAVRDSFGKELPDALVVMNEFPYPDPPDLHLRLTEPGMLVFPMVALGKRWRANVPMQMDEPREFDGPQHAGEVVDVELRTDPAPTLNGRLMLAGVARADTKFRLYGLEQLAELAGPGFGWSPFAFLNTDAEGRFRVELAKTSVGHTIERLTILMNDGYDDDGFEAAWTGSLRLDPIDHDLGTLTLARKEPLPVLVAGRVLSDATDLADVRLGLTRKHGTGTGWPDGAPQLQFDLATGAFTFRGTAPTDEFTLHVESIDHQWIEPMRVRKGQTGVRVRLLRHGSVTATFATTSRDFAMCIRPALLVEGEHNHTGGVLGKHSLDGDQRLTCAWTKLEPRSHRLVVRCAGTSTPLLEVPGLAVHAGGRCDDPRLRDIRLPDLKVLAITVPKAEDPERRYVQPSSVQVLEDDRATAETQEDGGVRFLCATARPVDLRVRVHGYRERVLSAVFEDRTVELEPGIAVDLTADTTGLPPHRTFTLKATLEGGRGESFAVTALPHAGHHRVLLPCPGRYELSAEIWAPPLMETVDCEPEHIEVGEAGGTFAVRTALVK